MRMIFSIVVTALLSAGLCINTSPSEAQFRQQPGQFAPSVLAPQSLVKQVPGKDPLTISPSNQQSLQATWQARLGFSCNPIVCVCRGDDDCNDMFGTTVCGGRAICIDDYCYCDRRALRVQ